MNCCIIACRTLEKELLTAMARTGCTYPVRWLEAGQHNRKDARRAEIQNLLDDLSDYDTVLVAATLCGGCVTGLKSRSFRLVVPRCDDCITLLLGSPENRKKYPATYFLTEGWLAGKDSIEAEYDRTLEKHGPERTGRIFSAMLANYRAMAFLDTGCANTEERIQELSEKLGLSYIRIPGTLSYLEALLSGSWDAGCFVILEPNCVLTEAQCLPPHKVTILPENRTIFAPSGTNLLGLLQQHSRAPDAPCGGNGKCGKCLVWVDGQKVSACKTEIVRDMTVTLPKTEKLSILQTGIGSTSALDPIGPGCLLAFDIGTTSVVCCLMDEKTGKELASAGAVNPQRIYGADVISRIHAALSGKMDALTVSIRSCMSELAEEVCQKAGILPGEIGLISVVGNPAMQQLFLGVYPDNLATVPFAPVLTEASAEICGNRLPCCRDALLLTVPDISGYIGADTLACVLSTGLSEAEETTLLVDIGTNGELVLGNKERLIACSTAAGPALEGANIRFGMNCRPGAIDRVWPEDGQLKCSVIGGGKAKGICGSGLIDAVAAAMKLGLLNKRGRIQNEERIIHLSDGIYLTQEDIRQVQLAKGAIHAGIELMVKELGISLQDIRHVLLAGAFGSNLNPKHACRMGLLPRTLESCTVAVGNAALAGAKMLARDHSLLAASQSLAKQIEFLELASLPEFSKTFAKAMEFDV